MTGLEVFLAASLVLGTTACGSILHLSWSRHRKIARRRTVSKGCAISSVQVDARGTLTGRHGPLQVTLTSYDGDDTGNLTRIIIDGLPSDLRLVRIGPLWRPGSSAPRGEAVEVGDPDLERELWLEGPPVSVCALFDAATRASVREAFRTYPSLAIERGVLRVDSVGLRFGGRPRMAPPELKALLDLAYQLRPLESPVSKLAQIAHADPLPTVRARALLTLAEREPYHAEAQAALRTALRDPVPSVRLEAARALGDEGEETLLALAGDTEVDDACGAAAMAALGERLTAARGRPILEWTARTPGQTRRGRRAVEALARDGAAAAPELAEVLQRSQEPVAVAAAVVLGLIGSPASETPLVAALAAPSAAVATAAANALGRFATVAAVPMLREAEARGGEVRRASRTAIAAIQSRLSGASPGQVSLSDGEAGQVSVVDSADGRVSLEADE